MPFRKCVRKDPPASSILLALMLFFAHPTVSQAASQDLFDPSEEAHPGALVEVMYARAEINYGKGKLTDCVAMLNRLLTRDSRYVPALQLKILALKTLKDLSGAADTYQVLMFVPSEKSKVPQYSFELALIDRELQKPEVARLLFNAALAGRYAEAESHFYLGLLDADERRSDEALEHFAEAIRASTPANTDIRIASLYQLGLANLDSGHTYFGDGALYDVIHAYEAAPDKNSSAKSISTIPLKNSAKKILERVDKPEWFFTASVEGQYDSNLAELPTSNNASGAGAARLLLSGGIGHIGSALSSYQWVEAVRFFGGYSLPTTAEVYQYETLAPALYLNHEPLSATPWGLKAESGLTAQGQDTGSVRFPFLYSFDLGGFIKHRTLMREEWELDAGVRPQLYQTSDASGFSGQDYYGRASWRREGSGPYYNPFASVMTDFNSTADAANTSLSFAGQFGDSLRLNTEHTLNLSLAGTYYNYSSAARTDIGLSLAAGYSYKLSHYWSLISDFAYTINTSSIPTVYSYNRLVLGTGIAVAL